MVKDNKDKNNDGKVKDNENLRFLVCGDFHSDLKIPNKILKSVDLDKVDVVLFSGDLSDGKGDFKELLKPFANKRILMIPGNHETRKQINNLVDFYDVELLGNKPLIFNEKLAIFGSNYSSIGPYGISEDEVFTNLVENWKAVEDVPFKVQINHIPPTDTEIGDASPYHFVTGSEALFDFLEDFSPDKLFVGHIHESSGLEEKIFNTDMVCVANTFRVFDFDFDKLKLIEVPVLDESKGVSKKSKKKSLKK